VTNGSRLLNRSKLFKEYISARVQITHRSLWVGWQKYLRWRQYWHWLYCILLKMDNWRYW